MLDATKYSVPFRYCQGLGARKSEIRNPNSEISARVGGSRIEYPVSSIQYPVSSIQYPVSSIEYRVSSIGWAEGRYLIQRAGTQTTLLCHGPSRIRILASLPLLAYSRIRMLMPDGSSMYRLWSINEPTLIWTLPWPRV
jgi:hypothetical protein